jgi:hypothetical protein
MCSEVYSAVKCTVMHLAIQLWKEKCPFGLEQKGTEINRLVCSAVRCGAVQCSAVQCSAVQCSAVQCSAVQCSSVAQEHD